MGYWALLGLNTLWREQNAGEFLFRRIIMTVLNVTFRRKIMAFMKLPYYTANYGGF